MATAAVTVPSTSDSLSTGVEEGNGMDPSEPSPPALTVALPQAVVTDEQTDDLLPLDLPPDSGSILKRWTYYIIHCVMVFSAFAVIIAGMASRHENGWGLAFIICYSCWTLVTSICLGLNLAKPGLFLKRSFSHLACCALTLYFFGAALHISSTDLPMYIPICINLGLLLSMGIQQIPLPTKMQILSYFGLGYYEIAQQPPILPLVQPRFLIPRPGVDGRV